MAARVPFLAVHGAGVTADASVEIDDEAELLLTGHGSGNGRHDFVPDDLRTGSGSHGFLRPSASKRSTSGRGGICGGRLSVGNSGSVVCSLIAAFSTRTRTSYQAACPDTGSEFEWR